MNCLQCIHPGLALRFVQAYKSDAMYASSEAVDRLNALLVELPAAPNGDDTSRDAHIDAAAAWADSALAWAERCAKIGKQDKRSKRERERN